MRAGRLFPWAVCCLFLLPFSAYTATHDVMVGNNFFSPNDLTIEVGDTVRWTNNSGRNHDVTADDFSWASQTSSSFVFERTFNSVEEILYHCTVHSAPGRAINSNQNGRINVVPDGVDDDPVAAYTISCDGLDCNFTDQSTDSNGTIVSWAWEFGDGVTSNVQNPSHTYAAAGTYSTKLTVTNNGGISDDENQSVTVTDTVNQDPVASFTSACIDLDCNFTDQSVDVDGSISARSWTFGDGGTSTATNPSYSYSAAGTYSVGLTVTDNEGASGSTTRSVTVSEAQFDPILINSGMSDAWFNPLTDGQGFFIIVWENSKFIFLSWFTFDTERPPADVSAFFGGPGQRWVTAQGPYEGDTATLDVFLSTGGTLDSPEPPVVTDPNPIGTITITWTSCTAGTLTYDLPGLGLMGVIPIQRIVLDNVPMCEAGQVMGFQ